MQTSNSRHAWFDSDIGTLRDNDGVVAIEQSTDSEAVAGRRHI
jgi:hypothetical protein